MKSGANRGGNGGYHQQQQQQHCLGSANKLDGSNYLSDEQLFKSAEATLQRSMEHGGIFACKTEQDMGAVIDVAASAASVRKFAQRGMESPCSQASSTSMHSEATHGPLTPPATPAFLSNMVRSSPSQIERIQRDTAFSRVQMMGSPSAAEYMTHNDYSLNHAAGYSNRAATDTYRSYPQIYHSHYSAGFGAPSSALPHVAAYTGGCPSTSTNYGGTLPIDIGANDFDRYLDVEDRKLPYVYKGADDHIQELNPVMTAMNNEQSVGALMRNNSLSPTATMANDNGVAGTTNTSPMAAAAAADTDSISIPNHGGFFYHPDHHLPTYQYWSNNYSTNS